MRTVIIGTGPAGCATAFGLLSEKKNADVVILGDNLNATPVRCGGGLSRFMMRKVGLQLPDEVIASPIRHVRLYSPNLDYWQIDCKDMDVEDMGYILHRGRFDRWLLHEAEKLGVRVYPKKVSRVDLRGIGYDVLVGADGVYSVVAGFVGRGNLKPYDLHHGIQLTVDWKAYPEDLVCLYFGSVAPGGYAWIFPCGSQVRIGLGVPLSLGLNPRKLLDEFIMEIGAPCDGQLISKLVPTAKPPQTGVYGDVLLVGDALPACDPATGGGIVPALSSGLAAGRAIAEGNLERYDRYWKRRFYWRNRVRYKMKKLFTGLSDQDFNRLIAVLKTFQVNSISLEREMGRALFYLGFRQPGLLCGGLLLGEG